MTQLDFRALAQELVEELEAWIAYGDEADCARAHAVVDRALTALATPEPEPPADEELVAFLYLIDPEDELSPLAMARAALERWGNA